MNDDGRHDFDFWVGASWKGENRKRVKPLLEGDGEWVEFEGWCEARPILGGLGNTDEFSAPDFPGRPGFEGFSLRLFEPETQLWRIWWASTVGTARIDPPVVGRFEDGIGRFECDEVIEGVALRTRYRVEGHHAGLGALGAVLLLRPGLDLGHELDRAARARLGAAAAHPSAASRCWRRSTLSPPASRPAPAVWIAV